MPSRHDVGEAGSGRFAPASRALRARGSSFVPCLFKCVTRGSSGTFAGTVATLGAGGEPPHFSSMAAGFIIQKVVQAYVGGNRKSPPFFQGPGLACMTLAAGQLQVQRSRTRGRPPVGGGAAACASHTRGKLDSATENRVSFAGVASQPRRIRGP